MAVYHSYGDISKRINQSDVLTDKKPVFDRMIRDLPETPWADIKILDWMPEDDDLPVEYSFAETRFGKVLAASTSKGLCYLGLANGKPEAVLTDLGKRFAHAPLIEKQTRLQMQAVDFLEGKRNEFIALHLRGTPYQTAIWRRLIRIPSGNVVSYTTLAGSPQRSRAAGTANGRNPVFMIVPCHRTVHTDGTFDRYFWGKEMKKRLLAWEFAGSMN